MTAIPNKMHTIESAIDAHHESLPQPYRQHLGCSILGHVCDRHIWFSFRWVADKAFQGRILRLFRRGQLEESTIVADLESIGVKLSNTGDKQMRVDLGCHVGGSLDGIIESGLPGAEKTRHVLECKTHSLKSFKALESDGVEKAKPEHYVQMQLYMHGAEIDRALYFAVCKDDDRIYTERVKYDRAFAEKYVARGKRLSLDDRIPPPISTNPSWYQCKYCDYYSICHQGAKVVNKNCRTCQYAVPQSDSSWSCENYEQTIPIYVQPQGCEAHVLHCDLEQQ